MARKYYAQINGNTDDSKHYDSDRAAAEANWDAIKAGDRVRTWNDANFNEMEWSYDHSANAISGEYV